MDRRFKDYYIVTFKKTFSYWRRSGYETTQFCHFPRPIKIHWRSINGIPYALASVDKDISGLAGLYFEETVGVDKVILYTEEKERDMAMWQKILRLPENDYWVKCKIQKCMQQDLFIDWEV